MLEQALRHCRILIVEDEYLIADELRAGFDDAGAMVLGPVATVEKALDLIGAEDRVDGVVLDVNLRGEMTFPVADLLIERGVPFVFTTGYDASVIPSRFERVMRCGKPIDIDKITSTIGRVIDADPSSSGM